MYFPILVHKNYIIMTFSVYFRFKMNKIFISIGIINLINYHLNFVYLFKVLNLIIDERKSLFFIIL